jgi:hypothetical protein
VICKSGQQLETDHRGDGDKLDRLDWVIAAPVYFHIVRY